jgi:putative transposase
VAEIDLSVGTVGDAHDNALAERVIGLFKTEIINQIGNGNRCARSNVKP